MSDFERYGDYNEVDESPSKSSVLLAIKATAIVLLFSVVGLLLFRVFTINYYPKTMKNVYIGEPLKNYCEDNGGEIIAKTQEIRAPYDDPELGNFFADHLVVIEELGELQVSLRYNVSIADTILAEYGVEFDPDDTSRFGFSLTKSGGDDTATGAAAGVSLEAQLTYCETGKFMMYRYIKLVFDGVDFDGARWIRLNITIDGVPLKTPYMIAIYENVEEYNGFADYPISSEAEK